MLQLWWLSFLVAYERISVEWKDLDIYILRGAEQEQVIGREWECGVVKFEQP